MERGPATAPTGNPAPSALPKVLMSGCDAVILLASARGVTEAGDHFVQDQQRAVVLCELAKPLQISIARQDAAHVGHDRLGDDGGEFACRAAS